MSELVPIEIPGQVARLSLGANSRIVIETLHGLIEIRSVKEGTGRKLQLILPSDLRFRKGTEAMQLHGKFLTFEGGAVRPRHTFWNVIGSQESPDEFLIREASELRLKS